MPIYQTTPYSDKPNDALKTSKNSQNAATPSSVTPENENVKFNSSCAKLPFNCPPVSDPHCVKIKYATHDKLNKTIYIRMINKCEMEYMKCYEDPISVEVPLKYCESQSIKGLLAVNFQVAFCFRRINDALETESCPISCPSRGSMVCAKCKDGVYRTFISVCHLKLFNCKYPDEKVRMVSRNACVVLAPRHYDLEEMDSPAVGHDDVEDSPTMDTDDDDDPVLRYIWCLNEIRGSILQPDDPRCKGLRDTPHRLLG